MGHPIHNPFYVPLLVTCGLLLVTMLVYLVGMYYVPNSYSPRPLEIPAWLAWIDRHALLLIAGELGLLVVLAGLTIGLDRFFDPPSSGPPTRHRPPEGSGSGP